jgi:hypothetical protein
VYQTIFVSYNQYLTHFPVSDTINSGESPMSNQNQEPPWGKRRKPQTPEELVAQLIKKLQDFFTEKKNANSGGDGEEPFSKPANTSASIGKVLTIILAGVIVQGLYTSIYKIAPSEVGVILRFGKIFTYRQFRSACHNSLC